MAAHELYLLHLGQLGSRDPDTGEAHYSQVPGYLIRTARGRMATAKAYRHLGLRPKAGAQDLFATPEPTNADDATHD